MQQPSPRTLSSLPTLIFHPGSYTVRFNAATQDPQRIPHCLARKRLASSSNRSQMYPNSSAYFDVEQGRIQSLVSCIKKSLTPSRGATTKFTVYDENNSTVVTNRPNPTPNLPEILYCEDALKLLPDAPYDVFFPIEAGRLNFDAYRSPLALEADLVLLWKYIFTKRLGLPLQSLQDYNIVLLVSDLYRPSDLALMVKILFDEFKFAGMLVQKESVCAAIGSARMPCCVVDVGHTRTSVCCIGEVRAGEGFDVLPGTSFSIRWGGHHITTTLAYMLARQGPPPVAYKKSTFGDHHWPYADIDLHKVQDYFAISRLKEECCHLQPRAKVVTHTFSIRSPINTTQYTVNMSKALRMAPFTLFCPVELFTPMYRIVSTDRNPSNAANWDPEDTLGWQYLERRRNVLRNLGITLPTDVDLKEESKRIRKRKKEEEKKKKAAEEEKVTDTSPKVPESEGAEARGDDAMLIDVEVDAMDVAANEVAPNPSDEPYLSELQQQNVSSQILSRPTIGAKSPARLTEIQKHHEETRMEISDNDQTPFDVIEGEGNDLLPNPGRIRMTLPSDRFHRSLPVPITQLIIESIGQVVDRTLVPLIAENIVLTGGSSLFPDLKDMLEDKLFEIMPRTVTRFEVWSGKEISMELGFDQATAQIDHSWHGVQKLLGLMDPNEDFLSREVWLQLGPYKALRTRLPFPFDHYPSHQINKL